MKKALTLLTLVTAYTLCQAQGIQKGIYYVTNKKNTKVEITQCCSNGKLNIIFLKENGSKTERELDAIQGTEDLYLYPGDGFYYIIMARNGHLERYSFDEARRPEFLEANDTNITNFMEIWSQDQAYIQEKSSQVQELNEVLENRDVRLSLGDLVALKVKPSEVTIPFGKLYGKKTGKDKETLTGSLSLKALMRKSMTISAFDPKTSFPGVESVKYHPYNPDNKSMIVVKTERGLYTFFRSNFDPNLYIALDGHSVDDFIKFMPDGNHLHGKVSGIHNVAVTVYSSSKNNSLSKEKLSSLSKKTTTYFNDMREKIRIYVNNLMSRPVELPDPKMQNATLEKNILSTMNMHAKDQNWSETFNKAIIVSRDWITVRNKYSGVIEGRYISAALVGKWPDGRCTYQTFDLWQEYIGGKFQGNLRRYANGSQYKINCN